MSAVTRYLAEIPWNCCIPEENWDFVSITDDSEDMRKEKRKIFLVNATFPFYIPMELHSMDVWAMRENCPDGQYWAVASLFLLYNNSHTIFAWDKIGSDNYSEMHEDLCRPSISTQMLSEIFPSSIPQCKSAVHFLLDLTVLVQLPFKPVLLHQWLVAAYQQLLRFQIEMVEFSFIPFDASQDDAVDDIFQMLKSLALNIQCGFEYLRLKIYNKNMIKDSVLEGFDTAVQKICLCVKHLLLPFEISTIDFGMREVKEQVWYPGSGSKYVPKSMKSARTQLEKRAFVDDFLWWKIPKDKRWIFGDYSQGMNSHLTEQFFANNDLEFYNPFLEPIPEKVKNDKEFISCFTLYKKHENNLITIFHTVRVEDRGILENIYFLEAKRDLKISLVRMLKRYAELIDDPNLPYMLLQEANQMIDEVMPEESRDAVRTPVKYNDFKEPFIPLRKILIELQGSVGEHEKSKKPMTYMVLQDRIRSLVYRTIAAQYKVKGSKKDDVGRDWHIGFLLPCFVSSLLELNEDPAVDEELKNWYMNFIDQLIASYEETGFEKLNNVTVSSGIEECSALFVLQNLKRPALLLSYFKTIERAFLAEMQGAPSILMHFKKYHLFDVLYESLEFSEEKADLLREPSIPWMWQLLEFFRRMEKALRSCATERSVLKDPFNTEVTEEQMIELIKLMWIAGTDQSAFKSYVSSPAEILRALCTLHHSEQLSEFLNDVTDCEESVVLCTKKILRIALDLVLRRAGRRFEFSMTMKATCSPLDMAFHSFLTKAAVASLFLIYNNSHALSAWQHKFSKDFEELCRPSISTQMLSEIFPSPIPTCDSAANFLLDSGVLVQLPFKPVLLHQWLVATYYEMLLLETEMLEFFFLPFPESLKVHVDDMTTLLINLDHQIRWGFNFLNADNKPNDTSTIERFDGVVRTICKCLAWLLLPLGGSDGYRHIRNLKVNCWYPGSINEKTAKTSRNYAELSMSKRNFVYNSWWWRMPESKRRLFGRSSEDRKEKYAAFYLYSDSLYNSKSRSQFRKCVIEMGMIDKESVNFKDVFNSRGILGNICILEAKRDFKLLMLQQCGSRDPNSLHEFVLMANKWLDGETSDESDHECGLSVTPIEHCDEGIYNALKKILINWGEPINQLSLNFFDYITASFQKRLQKLVFGTISAQYKMPGSKKDDVGRDWNMGYLLSCFVASSLDLNESPAVDGKLKIWYMNFIDRLITEYETDGFEKLNNYCVSDGIDKCSALFVLHFMKKPALLLSYFKTIEKAFLAEMEGAHNVIKHFKKYHLFGVLYESLEFSEEKTDLLRKPCIPWMWQLLEFFKKMERALRCCATEKSILNDPFSTDVTEDQMIELIKLMWISGTDQNAFRSNVSDPAEILRSLFFENSSSHLLELSQKFKLEAKMLPPKNILRIAFDMALYSTGRNFEFCPTLKPTCSPLDMAFHSFLTKANHGQMWALREFASKYFGADSVIHSDHSSSEDNICYFIVQNLIGWDKKVKLKRDSPLWFFPIENCRECGSVRPVAGSFLPCGDCFHGKYPDLVVYCSEDCKNEASIAHQQEHQGFEQFKSSKIGLNLLKF